MMTPTQLHERYPTIFPTPVPELAGTEASDLVEEQTGAEEPEERTEELPKFKKHSDGILYHGGIKGTDDVKRTYRLKRPEIKGGGFYAHVSDHLGWRLIGHAELFKDAVKLCVKHAEGKIEAAAEKTYTSYHGLEEPMKYW